MNNIPSCSWQVRQIHKAYRQKHQDFSNLCTLNVKFRQWTLISAPQQQIFVIVCQVYLNRYQKCSKVVNKKFYKDLFFARFCDEIKFENLKKSLRKQGGKLLDSYSHEKFI